MASYNPTEVNEWKEKYRGKLIRGTVTSTAGSKYAEVHSADGSPLPEDDRVLICFTDTWWPANFGGSVVRIKPDRARVTVFTS